MEPTDVPVACTCGCKGEAGDETLYDYRISDSILVAFYLNISPAKGFENTVED
jgi:hypothetical protein